MLFIALCLVLCAAIGIQVRFEEVMKRRDRERRALALLEEEWQSYEDLERTAVEMIRVLAHSPDERERRLRMFYRDNPPPSRSIDEALPVSLHDILVSRRQRRFGSHADGGPVSGSSAEGPTKD